MQREGVVRDRVGPEIDGRDLALLDATAAFASRPTERVHTAESLIGWAPGPFAMGGVRGDRGHTDAVRHSDAPFCVPLGNERTAIPRRHGSTWRWRWDEQ